MATAIVSPKFSVAWYVPSGWTINRHGEISQSIMQCWVGWMVDLMVGGLV